MRAEVHAFVATHAFFGALTSLSFVTVRAVFEKVKAKCLCVRRRLRASLVDERASRTVCFASSRTKIIFKAKDTVARAAQHSATTWSTRKFSELFRFMAANI